MRERLQDLKSWEEMNRSRSHTAGIDVIHYGICFIFLYFGGAKIIFALTDIGPVPPVVSGTAEAMNTIPVLELITPDPITFTILVGAWEVLIGLCFVTRDLRSNEVGLLQLAVHQPATFVPFVLAPSLTFSMAPLLPTFSGLYILKNFVIIGGGLVLWNHIHEGDMEFFDTESDASSSVESMEPSGTPQSTSNRGKNLELILMADGRGRREDQRRRRRTRRSAHDQRSRRRRKP